jgi:hypothetical protein
MVFEIEDPGGTMEFQHIWAFIDSDDGDNAMVAATLPMVGSVPLATLEARRLAELERVAQKIADERQRPIRLVRFRRIKIEKILRPRQPPQP